MHMAGVRAEQEQGTGLGRDARSRFMQRILETRAKKATSAGKGGLCWIQVGQRHGEGQQQSRGIL